MKTHRINNKEIDLDFYEDLKELDLMMEDLGLGELINRFEEGDWRQ